MGRLTLRLPGTLHSLLESLARKEGVSLNQYIVYALTRQSTLAYIVQAIPEKEIEQQKYAYAALLESLESASFHEIEKVMQEREKVDPEPGLSPEMVARLERRLVEDRPRV